MAEPRGPGSHVGPTGRAKIRYATRDWAKRTVRLKRTTGGGLMHIYRCDSCLGYHLASGPRRRPDGALD